MIINYAGETFGSYGDLRFRSPEEVSGKQYGFSARSWSFGILLFLALTGKYPFDIISDTPESE